MNLKEKIERSLTSVVKVVFPHTTNNYDTLFGGTALQWIDEVAFISAVRFSKQKLVTVSFDKTDFQKPIPSGNLVELVAKVTKVGTTSVTVKVEVFIEHMYSDEEKIKCIEATVTFVAIDNDRNPVPVNK